MILANEQVAGYLAERKLPALYRVHEKPDPNAVAAMVARLAALEVPTPALPDNMSPQQAADVAGRGLAAGGGVLAQRPAAGGFAFGSMVLRSLKQAYYTPRNLGHAGLASARYSHFTSPIRRWPDIVAHRALLAGLGLDDAAPRAHELGDMGIASSETERAATKIERDADDVCLAFLLERRLHEQPGGDEPAAFDGEIVGLISAGAFVRFGEEGFEGMLPVRRLEGWWELDEHEVALVHGDSGRRLGSATAVACHGREHRRRPRPGGPGARRSRLTRLISSGWPRRESARQRPGTSRPTGTRRIATTCSTAGSAGSSLQGSEVKSLRDGGVQIKDAYAHVLATASYGCTTCTSRLTCPLRARTTSPSARASCCCTGVRSSGSSPRRQEKGLDPGPDPDLLQERAREARARPGTRQGPLRQAPRPEGEGPEARDPARAVRAHAIIGRRA